MTVEWKKGFALAEEVLFSVQFTQTQNDNNIVNCQLNNRHGLDV